MSDWVPRSGYDTVGGYVWLPRLLDKVRQALLGAPGEYYILEASPVDQAALKTWRVSGDQIREWVGEGLSDEAIAERIQQTGGTDPKTWSRLWCVAWGGPMLIFDADEGRIQGPGGAVLKGIIPGLLIFRRAFVALGITRP